MRILLAISIGCATCLSCGILSAQDAEKSIGSLIEALKSTQSSPALDHDVFGHEYPFSEVHDWRDYERVRDAWSELNSRFEEALPELVKHSADKEYSITCAPLGYWRNRSVGQVCQYIIHANVEPFSRPTLDGYYSSVISNSPADDESGARKSDKPSRASTQRLRADGGVRSWWKTRKGMSLAELQLDAIRWSKEHPPERIPHELGTPSKEKLEQMRAREVAGLLKFEKIILEKGAMKVRPYVADEIMWGGPGRKREIRQPR